MHYRIVFVLLAGYIIQTSYATIEKNQQPKIFHTKSSSFTTSTITQKENLKLILQELADFKKEKGDFLTKEESKKLISKLKKEVNIDIKLISCVFSDFYGKIHDNYKEIKNLKEIIEKNEQKIGPSKINPSNQK